MVPASKPFVVVFAALWCIAVCSFGLWIIIKPERYWAMWQKWLDQNQYHDPNDWLTIRYEQIQDHVDTKNPKRKGRLLGLGLVVLGIAVGLLFARVAIYGPFGS